MQQDHQSASEVGADSSGALGRLADWDHPASNWNRAAMSSPQADPFCCRTEWQLSFHEAMAPARKLVVREVPGSAVAFAELRRPNAVLVLSPVESNWQFGSPLLGPDAVDLLEALLAEYAARPGLNEFYCGISGLECGGELAATLRRRLGSSFDATVYHEDALRSASLDGGLDGYLSRRSARQRKNLGKQQRRAAREGVTFERHVPSDADQATRVYARMLAVEELSWKGIGECGMTVGRARRYYDCMLRRLSASEGARVMFARHAGRDIGYIFGGMAGDVYRGQQFSFADAWKSYSIGNLLQLEQISWLCEEQAVRYDMGPYMEYKKRWTEGNRTIQTLLFRRK